MSGRTVAWWLAVGFLALVILATLSLAGTMGTQVCSGGSVNGVPVQEQCETDYGPVVPLLVILSAAILFLVASVIGLRRSIRGDRARFD